MKSYLKRFFRRNERDGTTVRCTILVQNSAKCRKYNTCLTNAVRNYFSDEHFKKFQIEKLKHTMYQFTSIGLGIYFKKKKGHAQISEYMYTPVRCPRVSRPFSTSSSENIVRFFLFIS